MGASGEAARSGDEWTTAVEDTFVSNDPDASGVIHRILARNLLMRSGLGLTHYAIYHLLSIVDEDDDGLLSYQSLATSAGPILHSQLNELASAIAYAKYVRKYAGTDLGEVDIKTFLKIALLLPRDVPRRGRRSPLLKRRHCLFPLRSQRPPLHRLGGRDRRRHHRRPRRNRLRHPQVHCLPQVLCLSPRRSSLPRLCRRHHRLFCRR